MVVKILKFIETQNFNIDVYMNYKSLNIQHKFPLIAFNLNFFIAFH